MSSLGGWLVQVSGGGTANSTNISGINASGTDAQTYLSFRAARSLFRRQEPVPSAPRRPPSKSNCQLFVFLGEIDMDVVAETNGAAVIDEKALCGSHSEYQDLGPVNDSLIATFAT